MPRILYISRRKKTFILIALVLFCVFFTSYIYKKINSFQTFPVFAAEKTVSKTTNFWSGLLGNIFNTTDADSVQKKPLLDKILGKIAQVDISDPKRMLAMQLIAAPGKEEWYNSEPENEDIYIPLPKKEKVVPFNPPEVSSVSGKPLIGIYSTHNAETYQLSDGVDKVEGKNGGVMKAAIRLKEELNKNGVGAVCDATIHDYPNWPQSYRNSLQTAKKLLKDYPSIQILIDVHRDAMPSRESSITKINGKNVARISFIVGSDTRSPHPNWKKNWAYANYIAEVMEKDYPGLLKTVRVQSGRYNQHLNPHSILIEVGSTKNSKAEAERSMELLAKVMSDTIGKR